MSQFTINVHPNVEKRVSLGYIFFEDLHCQKKNLELWKEIEDLATKYRNEYSSPSEALEKLRPARDLYRAIGIEPTKVRPSSEALFRRAVRGKQLYQINSIVDVSNLCSMKFFLPIGLYDTDKIQGEVILRLGYSGETYQGIGKGEIHVQKRLVLADDQGAFGNPSSDSLRTSITLETRNILMVIFAPNQYPSQQMIEHLNYAKQKMLLHHPRGKVIDSKFLKKSF